jgi:putative addiction module CopG family antidote
MDNMGRKIINISVPPELHAFVQDRVEAGNYGSISEYFRELIRLDQRRELEEFDESARLAMQTGSRQFGTFRRNY